MRLPTPPDRRTGLRWWLDRRRRPLAAALAAMAVWCAIAAVRPTSHLQQVIAVDRDLPGGAVLRPADLHWVGLPAGAVPAGALRVMTAAVGHPLAAAVRAGEPLTDIRLGRSARLAAGTVAATIRLADPAAAGVLRVGSRVDVLAVPDPDAASVGANVGAAATGTGDSTATVTTTPATPPASTSANASPSPAGPAQAPAPATAGARVIATDVLVIALPGTGAAGAAGTAGGADPAGLVELETTTEVATALASAASDRLSVLERAG